MTPRLFSRVTRGRGEGRGRALPGVGVRWRFGTCRTQPPGRSRACLSLGRMRGGASLGLLMSGRFFKKWLFKPCIFAAREAGERPLCNWSPGESQQLGRTAGVCVSHRLASGSKNSWGGLALGEGTQPTVPFSMPLLRRADLLPAGPTPARPRSVLPGPL